MGFLYRITCQSGGRVIIGEECGDIAQLVERTDRTREAWGSNPHISKFLKQEMLAQRHTAYGATDKTAFGAKPINVRPFGKTELDCHHLW